MLCLGMSARSLPRVRNSVKSELLLVKAVSRLVAKESLDKSDVSKLFILFYFILC